jgi:hypothetical protein
MLYVQRTLDKGQVYLQEINLSSRQRCYTRTMTVRVQLQKKKTKTGREPQEAWRQDELIGGKQPVVSNSDSLS